MSDSAPLELWLPALARFAPDHPLRLRLARADRLPDGPRGYLAGLMHYFDSVGDGTGLAAAALLREHAAHDAGDLPWLCADPCWVQAEMNGARLLACGQLGLSMEEAEALAAPLRPVFDDAGMRLEVTAPDRWQLQLAPGTPVPDFAAPEQALGEDLFQHLPQGAEGRRWRVLINEVQVLLHQHPANAGRRARGLPPVNSLWLWGGGRLPSRVAATHAAVIGEDPLLVALAARAGVPVTPRTHASVLGAAVGTLVDLQDLPVAEIEQGWWPAIDALLRRQSVQLSFASGERWRLRPWHRWRLWRSAR
jgi:hypothetical protein